MSLAPAACGAKKKAGGWRARGGVHKSDCKIAFLARFFSKIFACGAKKSRLASLAGSHIDRVSGYVIEVHHLLGARPSVRLRKWLEAVRELRNQPSFSVLFS